MSKPIVIGTWPFSKKPVVIAWQAIQKGSCTLDAVEAGINVAEEDPTYGPYHIGCGGWCNSAGVLELDAAIMDGGSLDFGAVTALVGYSRAISVAKYVLTHSKHNMLTGAGAAAFANTHGFTYQSGLGSTKSAMIRDEHGKKEEVKEQQNHDTLGLLCVDQHGTISAGVSTSGAANKEPGRVGDSALPGAGLYADSEVGAACCSGNGDEILKHCASYRVVRYMKEGKSPAAACSCVINEILQRHKGKTPLVMVVIAVDKKGQVGAANAGVDRWIDDVTGEEHKGFPYVVMTNDLDGPIIHNISPVVL